MRRIEFLRKFLLTLTIFTMPSILKSQGVSMTKAELTSELEKAKSLKDLSTLLEKLEFNEKNLQIEGSWSIGTVLSHCAQSIRYSISGYPQMKSPVFRSTVGSAVFSIFSLRGKMSHGLEEPIPGAEKLDLQIPYEIGKKELFEAINQFASTKANELKPHFAYGDLSKGDYDNAHALHIKNHFQRISIR